MNLRSEQHASADTADTADQEPAVEVATLEPEDDEDPPLFNISFTDLGLAAAFVLPIAVGVLLPMVAVWVAQCRPDVFVPQPVQLSALEPLPPMSGHELYLENCATCHGARGQGQPSWGTPLRSSDFVRQIDDLGLVRFLKKGRSPTDPDRVMNRNMPARGGNPRLTDDHLKVLATYLRQMNGLEEAHASVVDE